MDRIISRLDEASMINRMQALERARKFLGKKGEDTEKQVNKKDDSKVQNERTGIYGRFGTGLG